MPFFKSLRTFVLGHSGEEAIQRAERVIADSIDSIDLRSNMRFHHDRIGQVLQTLHGQIDHEEARQARLSEELAQSKAAQFELERIVRAYDLAYEATES